MFHICCPPVQSGQMLLCRIYLIWGNCCFCPSGCHVIGDGVQDYITSNWPVTFRTLLDVVLDWEQWGRGLPTPPIIKRLNIKLRTQEALHRWSFGGWGCLQPVCADRLALLTALTRVVCGLVWTPVSPVYLCGTRGGVSPVRFCKPS